MTDEARKELLEQAYELADYIHKHPTAQHLPYRVAVLTGTNFADPEIDPLVDEVEKWLEQFEMQGKE
jgi:hypothetical protein